MMTKRTQAVLGLILTTMTKLSIGFEYNENELTKEQIERINSIRSNADEELKSLQEEEHRRAERYYNCEDDYSWGGLCSRANMIAQNRVEISRDWAIQEVVLGYIPLTTQCNILKDLNGNVVAKGTHEGKFGRFFVTDDGVFVSCRTKLSTYEKKGYIPYVVTTTEKATLKYNRNNEPYLKGYEVISVSEEASTEIVY